MVSWRLHEVGAFPEVIRHGGEFWKIFPDGSVHDDTVHSSYSPPGCLKQEQESKISAVVIRKVPSDFGIDKHTVALHNTLKAKLYTRSKNPILSVRLLISEGT